jgi:hypothetical protein
LLRYEATAICGYNISELQHIVGDGWMQHIQKGEFNVKSQFYRLVALPIQIRWISSYGDHAVHGRLSIFCYGRASGETEYVRVGQDVFKKTYKVFESFNACLGEVYRYLIFHLPPVSIQLTDVKRFKGITNPSVLTGTWNLNLSATEGLTNHEKQR